MRFKKIHLKDSTCLAFGMAGALCNLLTAALMLAGVGPAMYARTAAFVLYGAMLLVLAVLQKGDAFKATRAKLMGLFFLLMLGWPQLPLLDLGEALALPLFFAMLRHKGDGGWLAALALAEAQYAVLRTLGITSAFGPHRILVLGASLAAAGLVRGAALARLYRRAKALQGEAPIPSLKRQR